MKLVLKLILIVFAFLFVSLLLNFLFKKSNWKNYSWLHGFGKYSWPNKDDRSR